MPWFDAGPSGMQCELPTAAVGLLQNEAEMPRVPTYDVRPFLEGCPRRWRMESFTERSFGALLGPSLLDAVVLGYNSIHLSPVVKEALNARPPGAHLVILHQLRSDSLAFLRDRLAIGVKPIPGGGTDTTVPRPGDQGADDPLLNWPRRIDAVERAAAVCSLVVRPDSAWEVVLRLPGRGAGLPVLVRTRQLIPQRIVVCTLLLHNDRETHCALLENLITYAASGTPRIAVVEPPEAVDEASEGARLAERLRIQGAEVIRVRHTPGSDDPLEAWPLLGAERIVLPESTPVATLDAKLEAWLVGGRGRTLVRAAAQSVTVEARATDVEWVARRWALWFGTTAGERWDSVFAMRAVLRVLAALPGVLGEAAFRRLGPQVKADAYAGRVSELLRRRVRSGNVDATVAATAAALDLYELTGKRSLPQWQARSVRKWLEDRFADASFEERLDISRSLRAPELLRRALADQGSASTRLSLVAATRLREAAFACVEPEPPAMPDSLPAELDEHVSDDLARRPLLAAEFVAAAAACAVTEGLRDLGQLTGDVRAAALQGLTSLRGLEDDVEAVPPDAYSVCTEALALLSWLHAEKRLNAFQIRPEARDVPTSAVESLLAEALRAREQEVQLQDAVVPLRRAVEVLAALGLTGAAIAMLAVFRLLDVEIGRTAALAVLGGVVVTSVALYLLRRRLARPGPAATPPELRLAQHVLGVLAVMLTAAGVVAAVRLGGSVLGAVPMVALAAGAATVMVWLLERANLAPPWLEVVAGWLVTPPAFADWARHSLGQRPTQPSGRKPEEAEDSTEQDGET